MAISRRSFILGAVGAGAGIAVAVYPQEQPDSTGTVEPLTAVEWPPDAFVRLSPDGTITVQSKHTEMGQGIYSCLATVVAEELDAAWDDMRVSGAPVNAALYGNSWMGDQLTGGSTSLMSSWDQLRQVAAAMRYMLIGAAAKTWDVPRDEILTHQGLLRHGPSGREARYADFASRAAAQPVPEQVRLKSPDEYRLIGSNEIRVDVPDKTTGRIVYTQDLALPEMLTAVVAHPPRFGGRLASFDASDALTVEGVFRVAPVPSGVAIIATDFWTAQKARELLKIEWDDSDALMLGSTEMMGELRALVSQPGLRARDDGDVDPVFAAGHRMVEADFEFPYLAHAALEPMNCVVQISDDGCEIWHGAQWPTRDQSDAAEILKIPPESVKVNMLYAGGAFGRRASTDYVREAIEVAKAAQTKRPVKLMWSREDDMQGGMYRPMFYHHLRGAVDAQGRLIAWHQQVAGQSIAAQIAPNWLEEGIDNMSNHGARDAPYDIPNFRIESYNKEYPVPVLWYRGTGRSHTVFAMEAFMDALAVEAGMDPVAFRRPLLKQSPRLLNVMETAARMADWGETMPSGRARGIAIFHQRGTCIAQVAEVSLQGKNEITVDRVVTAIDVGIAVNPDTVRAQVEGGVGFGLSSALGDHITLEKGIVQQSNFDTYRLLRMSQMPKVETHIVPSLESPTGVGDISPVPIGPAVANALYRLTGTRIRNLPIMLGV